MTIIICTHNPREDYLRRTLDALQQQTLPKDKWELLLIDNASINPLVGQWDLCWHPHARHVREDELGLTPARLRGISDAGCELLVFVDDDNVLNPEYLATALAIAERHPMVGAFNGSIIGEFEQEPEEAVRFMLPTLAVREIQDVAWACQPGTQAIACAPCGAGMVIRREVAKTYAVKVNSDPVRKSLDRKGTALTSAGDSDMALCACAMGMGVGLFPELVMKHLIPKERLEQSYLIRLAEGMSQSQAILRYIWDKKIPKVRELSCRSERLMHAYHVLRVRICGSPEEKFRYEIRAASLRGEIQALNVLDKCRASLY